MKRVGNYELGKTIGRGQFGKVRLARHVKTGEKVAVKIIEKSRLSEDALRKVYREVKLMKLLRHPHVIRLYEVAESDEYLFLALEYAGGGEVLDYIVAHGRVDEALARKFFAQALDAVVYCHDRRVIHRDIKCENLLLDEHMNVKMIDFGLGNSFAPDAFLDTFCGSPTYCAPELIQRRPYRGPEVDAWSLGVVLFTMVVGVLPFDARDIQALFRKVLSGQVSIPSFVSSDCASLIRSLLTLDPQRRLTPRRARRHAWLRSLPPAPTSAPAFAFHAREAPVSDPETPRMENENENGELAVDETALEGAVKAGFARGDVLQALREQRFDERCATYFLLLDAAAEAERRTREHSPSPMAPAAKALSSTEMPPTPAAAEAAQARREKKKKKEEKEEKEENEENEEKEEKEEENEKAREEENPMAAISATASPTSPATAIGPRIRAARASGHRRSKSVAGDRPLPGAGNEAPRAATPPGAAGGWTLLSSFRQLFGSEQTPTGEKEKDKDKDKEMEKEKEKEKGKEKAEREAKEKEKEEKEKAKEKKESEAAAAAAALGSMSEEKYSQQQRKPRTARFAVNVNMTSAKPANEILIDLVMVLTAQAVPFTTTDFSALCCKDHVEFEVEVCKIPMLNLHGLKFTRVGGNAWEYKKIVQKIMRDLKFS